jgi:hypothetical protein
VWKTFATLAGRNLAARQRPGKPPSGGCGPCWSAARRPSGRLPLPRRPALTLEQLRSHNDPGVATIADSLATQLAHTSKHPSSTDYFMILDRIVRFVSAQSAMLVVA